MSFSVGIIGLPNVGKSTLFKALTKKKIDIASYPFTTIDPNIGIVSVPDKRLDKIAEIIKPEKITYTTIQFIDIAGLVKNAHKGEGLGNQFLSNIRQCDAIIEVIRDFQDPNVEHTQGKIDPEDDIKTIENELLLKDLETVARTVEKLEKQAKSDKLIIEKLNLIKKVQDTVSKGTPIRELNLTDEEKLEIKSYQFLTGKPKIYLFNTKEKKDKFSDQLSLDIKTEQEISELSESERQELKVNSGLDQIILTCYNILDLITFFSATGPKEIRAWTLEKGSTALDAANQIHSDLKEKFIKADVIPSKDLIEIGSLAKARELGKMQTKGKEYIVQDGDIIEIKI
tara:strand:- start:344 stop:1369 length:1026 start_codon:yes stop_codon:yes gene_type:complete